MSQRILSVSDCDNVLEDLEKFKSSVLEYFEQIQENLNLFNSNELVQSFYASGNLGKEMEQELKSILDAVRKYYDSLVDGSGLISVSKKVIRSQIELLNKGYGGR